MTNTEALREIAEDVYRDLGSGYLEEVYHRAMEVDLRVTVQIPMVVDFRGGGGWARAGAGDGNERQSVNS
jgi:hypothetical protein